MRRTLEERGRPVTGVGRRKTKLLDQQLARRREVVRIAGLQLELESLDDLDQVIDLIMRLQPPDKDPATGVAEVCPHFGVVWPSALALCELLCERSQTSKPTSILELGCGLALPSLIARKLGIPKVVATDRHALVPHFLERNAALNRLPKVEWRPLDWRHVEAQSWINAEAFDLVVGSDLLYEPWQPGHLAHALALLLRDATTEAWISDPGRRYLDTFATLAEAEGLECRALPPRSVGHGRGMVDVDVLVLRKRDFSD